MIWVSEGIQLHQSERIVPDGSNTLIFNLSSQKITSISNNVTVFHANVVAIGVLCKHAKVFYENHHQEHKQVGIIFQPGGASHFFKTFIGDLKDIAINNNDLQNNLFDEWYDQLLHLPTPAQKLQFLTRKLSEVLMKEKDNTSGIYLVDFIKHHSHLNVKDMALKSGYTEQHLNRLIKQHTGINIKSLQKAFRINHAMKRLNQDFLDIKLTELAYELDYFDQAHFIHDIKSSLGLSPSEVMASIHANPYQNERVLYS